MTELHPHLMSHRNYLLKALEIAKMGKGLCAPNPAVGALIVKDNDVISTGCHKGPGSPHAEVLAINSATQPVSGAILYVSLEPCNHVGRTPPCVDAIIKSGIKEVVWGYRDPNPLVRLKSTKAILEQHGIAATEQPQAEINTFYREYVYWMQSHKPYVTLKMAQSLDGKIAQNLNERTFLTDDTVNQFTHAKRNEADVILSTAKTINSDDPLLNVRIAGQKEKAKVVAILDRNLTIDTNRRLFSKAKHCYIFYDKQLTIKKAYPKHCQLVAVPVKEEKLDFAFVKRFLGGLGYHHVWGEVGATCFSSLLADRLINQLYIYFCPLWLGKEAISVYNGTLSHMFNKNESISWQLIANTAIARIDCDMAG